MTKIDEKPIETLVSVLKSLPDDDWRGRTKAFEAVVNTVLDSGTGTRRSKKSLNVMPWFMSYTAVGRLARPVSSLLLNSRSTVVKHTSHQLAVLVRAINDVNPPEANICKYLMKDLLPTVLAMHAQTVKTIQTYAFHMMEEIIQICRFKSGLPMLLERLTKEKSPSVREGCIRYLHLIIKYWTPHPDDYSVEETRYLTEKMCGHVGNGIAKALTDPALAVRKEAETAFKLFRFKFPDLWKQIIHKKKGIFSEHSKLKRRLLSASMETDSYEEDGSGSNSSKKSLKKSESAKGKGKKGRSLNIDEYLSSRNSKSSDVKRSSASKSSNSATRSYDSSRISASALRRRSSGSKVSNSGSNDSSKKSVTFGRTKTTTSKSSSSGSYDSSRRSASVSGRRSLNSGSYGSSKRSVSTGGRSYSSTRNTGSVGTGAKSYSSKSWNTTSFESKESLRTNNTDKSNRKAKSAREFRVVERSKSPLKNKTNRSIKQSRNQNVEQSSNQSKKQEDLENIRPSSRSRAQHNAHTPARGNEIVPCENYEISNKLLAAHKQYMTGAMDNLRAETNVLRDFETLVRNSSKSRGPPDQEVIKYYETVYGYLDKSAENVTVLRKEMQKVGNNK